MFGWISRALDAASDVLTGGDSDLDEVGELYSQLGSDEAREDFEVKAYEEGYKIHVDPGGSYYFVER